MESDDVLIANEYKDYVIDAPLVDQVVGAARRASGKGRLNATIFGIVIQCRGYTKDARKRADEHERNEGIRLMLKKVAED